MSKNGLAHHFISASLPSTGYSLVDDDNATSELNNSRRERRQQLPAAFHSKHQAALALDPCVDVNLLTSLQTESPQQILLRRPIYTQREIDERCEIQIPKDDFDYRGILWRILEQFRCSKQRAIRVLHSHLPIIDIVQQYNFREMLLIDVICGFTIGLVNIAHGMTNSLLANVPPTIGLYSSFYPVILYTLFGTSRTMSFGTLSITSILVGNAVLDISGKVMPSKAELMANNQTVSISNYRMQVQAELAFCITFVSGLVQLIAGVLQLGFITVYFADAMVTGFTTATMIYVITSQAKHLLGLKFESPTGTGNVFLTWAKVFDSLPQTNWMAVALSIGSAIILMLFKYVINPRLIAKIRSPFPIEAILMIVAAIMSSELKLEEHYKVDCLGTLPNGLPPPKMPMVQYFDDVWTASFVTAIINFAVTVSLAEVLARKNHTEIDPNQECFASGACNFLSSFFLCIPTGGGVSRSLIQDSMRPKTQMVGIVQSAVMLLVLLWIANFFSSLPQCVLAVIVLVALSAIGEQFKEAWKLWSISKLDCLIWIFSFTVTVSLDIKIGLELSILVSLFTLVIRSQFAESHILGNIPGTDLYKNIATYSKAREFTAMKIFRYCGEIHFACANQFRKALYEKTGANPKKILATKNRQQTARLTINESYEELDNSLKFVILDLSMCSFIDYGGLRILKQVIDEYRGIGVTILFAACPEPLQRTLMLAGFYETQDWDSFYVSVHDAVTFGRSNVLASEEHLLQ